MTKRPNRRSIRLRDWDYRWPGYYFVTTCTHSRRNLFADDRFYQIAADAWTHIPNHRHAGHVLIDEWVLMPNHLHGILCFQREQPDYEEDASPIKHIASGSLGAVIGNYKMLVTRRIRNLTGKRELGVWQRGYWERIIRNERELQATREYIRLNPLRWREDRDNLDHLLKKMDRRSPAR